MQSAAFFPPVFLLQDALGFVVFHVLLELVAGFATYFLLRRLDLGRAASTAGGVAFGLCGTLAWFEHATANPVAFLPLALLGVERAREAASTSRRYGWRLLAVALGPLHRVRISRGRLPRRPSRRASGPPCDSSPCRRGRRAMAAKLAQGGAVGATPRCARPRGLRRLPPSRRRRVPLGRLRQRLPTDSEPGPDRPPLRVRAYFRIALGGTLVASDDHVEQHRRLSRRHARRVRAPRAPGCPMPWSADRSRPLGARAP